MSGRFVEAAAGVGPDSGLRGALALREGLLEKTEASFRAALTPADPGGLPHPLRAALAARMAERSGDEGLAARYGAMAGGAVAEASDARMAAILAYVDQVTADPAAAGDAEIDRLRAAGVAEADIVRLAGLVAFVNYQLRLVHVLRLLEGGA